MTAPATMQNEVMRRSGALNAPPATMQNEVMRRSGANDG
jgi:hypothetical protein